MSADTDYLTPPPSLARGIVVGEANAQDLVDVVIPAFDEQQVFDNIAFMPRGDDTPAPGATCLVAFDDRHAPWVIAWYGNKASDTHDNGSNATGGRGPGESGPTGPTADGETGKVKCDPGNGGFVAQTTRPDGARVLPKKYLMDFLELVAGRIGHTLYTNTFSRHPRMTTDGYVSDHWTGNAADLHSTPPLDSALGDAICIASLRLCGVTQASAASLAASSTGYTRRPWKHGGLWFSVQVLWKVTGHHDHVHVGIRRANRGEFPGKY